MCSRLLKKSASIVLASLRSSTYPRGYASGPSLAAALLDGILNSLRALRKPFATTYALCFPESLNWFSTLW